MFQMNTFARAALLVAATLQFSLGVCMAEVYQGRIRSVASDAGLFTLDKGKGTILLIAWDKKTAWENLKSSSELASGEVISVDLKAAGDRLLAKRVTRLLPTVPDGVKTISLDLVAHDLDKPGEKAPFVLIDVRPSDKFEAGHIRGAISVPLRRIEKRTPGVLPEDRGTKLVLYDDGAGDGSAAKGAELVGRAGYGDVAVLVEGAKGWVDSGRFLASSSAYLRKSNAIIIDLRSPEKVASGHMEKAVNVPFESLAENIGKFPLQKRVAFVLYGDTDEESFAAARTLRNWGYHDVTIYPGGAKAWVESAEVLSHEQAGSVIPPASSKGGPLNANDFEMALASTSAVEIVDVRSATVQSKGTIPKSKNIPLHDLATRHGELDRGLIQVIFGENASQAEMAADFLSSKGFSVSYFSGRVEFLGDGKYVLK